MGTVKAEIERRLQAAFQPEELIIEDISHQHIGHAGHDPRGESHFSVTITSSAFAGQSRVQRQRAINRELADLLADRVHAMALRAHAPGEAQG